MRHLLQRKRLLTFIPFFIALNGCGNKPTNRSFFHEKKSFFSHDLTLPPVLHLCKQKQEEDDIKINEKKRKPTTNLTWNKIETPILTHTSNQTNKHIFHHIGYAIYTFSPQGFLNKKPSAIVDKERTYWNISFNGVKPAVINRNSEQNKINQEQRLYTICALFSANRSSSASNSLLSKLSSRQSLEKQIILGPLSNIV